jgi:hypothetical protein
MAVMVQHFAVTLYMFPIHVAGLTAVGRHWGVTTRTTRELMDISFWLVSTISV